MELEKRAIQETIESKKGNRQHDGSGSTAVLAALEDKRNLKITEAAASPQKKVGCGYTRAI